jgi:hypothetical protein
MVALAGASWAAAPVAARADGRELDLAKLRAFLLDPDPLVNMYRIDADPGLHGRSVSQRPWTSSFMPALEGYAGAPYTGQSPVDLILSFQFGSSYSFFTGVRMPQLEQFRYSMTEDDLENLAPAEKYDLITGMLGSEQSLTYRLWAQAKQGSDRDGLAFWTGMCNGWSPASIIFKRPESRIFVPSADGRFSVPFYPEDIKQLASTLFFNTTTVESETDPARFGIMGKMPMLGKRCAQKRLAHESSGFITDPACEDVTPHDWHVTVINLIGKQDQAFVADVEANSPVGNYPLWAYRFTYFNPMTGKDGDLKGSTVRLSDYRDDPFARHRSPLAKQVVGIKMTVWKSDYRSSDHSLEDGPDNDSVKTFDLKYDIEMAANGDIVGGQWRNDDLDNHPDFVWYPPKHAIANGAAAILPSAGRYEADKIGYTGEFDAAATGDWDPATPVPASWRTQARQAVGVTVSIADMTNKVYDEIRPQPLGKIVYGLVAQASQPIASPPVPVTPQQPTPPPAPVIRAKVSLQTGLFAWDERCDYQIAPTSDSPVLFEMPYVHDGQPIGTIATFTYWAASRADGQVDVWVRSRIYDQGKVDPESNRTQQVTLKKGGSSTVSVGFWWHLMRNNYHVDLSYDGQTVPAPANAKRLGCGQVFL